MGGWILPRGRPIQHLTPWLYNYSNNESEVGKVTLKSNGDEVLSNEFLLKSNGDEAFNDVFSIKSNGDEAFNAKKKL